jgi:hypothetical protein
MRAPGRKRSTTPLPLRRITAHLAVAQLSDEWKACADPKVPAAKSHLIAMDDRHELSKAGIVAAPHSAIHHCAVRA